MPKSFIYLEKKTPSGGTSSSIQEFEYTLTGSELSDFQNGLGLNNRYVYFTYRPGFYEAGTSNDDKEATHKIKIEIEFQGTATEIFKRNSIHTFLSSIPQTFKIDRKRLQVLMNRAGTITTVVIRFKVEIFPPNAVPPDFPDLDYDYDEDFEVVGNSVILTFIK